MVLLFLNADCLAPTEIKYIDWLNLLNGETSTAYFLTTPPLPTLVESSLAPAFYTALTKIFNGFSPVYMLII